MTNQNILSLGFVPCNKICKQQLESSLLYIVLFNTANLLVLSVAVYIAS